MPKNLSRLRSQAASVQSFRCFYCRLPMWAGNPTPFIEKFGLSERQAKLFQCTAEHLTAQCEGGKDTKANIAAACWYCNQKRHRTTKPLEPAEFQKRAQRCVVKGGWFPDGLAAKMAREGPTRRVDPATISAAAGIATCPRYEGSEPIPMLRHSQQHAPTTIPPCPLTSSP